jgi:hypothetical protein
MPKKAFKAKRSDFAVEMKTFKGNESTYLVMKVNGAYHVFTEVQAKDAARDCDPTMTKGNVRRMWDRIWARP